MIQTPPPIILKPSDPNNLPNQSSVNDVLKETLKNFPVNRTHISEKDTVIVDLPTTKVHEVAIKKLTEAFSNRFSVSKAERRCPRILVTNVPGEINDQSFKSFLL